MGKLFALLTAGLVGWFLFKLLGALIVGALARFLLPGKDKVGWGTTILVGFLGGVIYDVVGHMAGFVGPGRNGGILGALIGAIGLLAFHRVWVMARSPGKGAPPASS